MPMMSAAPAFRLPAALLACLLCHSALPAMAANQWTFEPAEGGFPARAIVWEKEGFLALSCPDMLAELLVKLPEDGMAERALLRPRLELLVDDKPPFTGFSLDEAVSSKATFRFSVTPEMINAIQDARNWVNVTIQADEKQVAEVMFEAEGTTFSILQFSAHCARPNVE
mgnify:CR=1 FL=1